MVKKKRRMATAPFPLHVMPILNLIGIFVTSSSSSGSSSSSSALCTLPQGFFSSDLILPPPSPPHHPITSGLLPSSFPSDDPFSPLRPCACESDWTDAFCARLSAYEQMTPHQAPSICLCRQIPGPASCVQFLTRCFRRSPPHPTSGIQSHRPPVQQCSCCFNQPDAHCSQLDCAQMRPQFGPDANTTCKCFLPTEGAGFALAELCAGKRQPQTQLSAREAPDGNDGWRMEAGGGVPYYGYERRRENPEPARAPLGRVLLLLALIGSGALAVIVCLGSHWLRRRRRKDAERGGMKRKTEAEAKNGTELMRPNNNNNGVLLEEATV